MQVIRQLPERPVNSCVIALGNFDGVHLGHQRLLKSGLETAQKMGLGLSVLLFDPHPLKLLFPERMLGLLTTQEERLNTFAQLGVQTVYLLPFTKATADMMPERFVSDILHRLGVRHVVVGFNYSFGTLGKGTPEDLRQLGQDYGFGVSVLQAQTLGGKVISSSSIRKALNQGDIQLAQQMLGRYPCFCGKVVQGEQRGRTLGYPTANLRPHEDLLIPKRGVYAVFAKLNGLRVGGMMNIGMKPTFHAEYETTVEVHFFDYQGNLYGQDLTLYLVERLRDERKFASVQELLGQLQKDAAQAKKVLSSLKVSTLENEASESGLYKS